MFREGLYSLLTQDSAIAGELGGSSARADRTTGVFSVQMPEATPMPAIVVRQIAGMGDVTLDGSSGLRNSRMQLSCYGRSFAQSERLAEIVWNRLEGMQETLPDGTEVDVALLLIESDTFEEAPFIYHTPLDIEFWFREPAAS